MYYSRLTKRLKYDLYDLAEDISQRSTLSKEYHHCKRLLERNIPEYLKDGRTLDLGRLGTLSLQANAKTASTADEVTWRNFKRLTAKFRPGKALKINLVEVNFKKV